VNISFEINPIPTAPLDTPIPELPMLPNPDDGTLITWPDAVHAAKTSTKIDDWKARLIMN
jgi:hypothetical protein